MSTARRRGCPRVCRLPGGFLARKCMLGGPAPKRSRDRNSPPAAKWAPSGGEQDQIDAFLRAR